MKETRFFYAPQAETASELPEEEANHATRVLRLKAGDELMLMDGKGAFFRAELTLAANPLNKRFRLCHNIIRLLRLLKG